MASSPSRKAVALAVAPEVAIPLEIAGRAAGAAERVLTGDIAVYRRASFRTVEVFEQYRDKEGRTRSRKVKISIPSELTVHVSGVSIGLGLLAVGGALFMGAVAWNGLSAPGVFGPVKILPGAGDQVKGWYDRQHDKAAAAYAIGRAKVP